ncbi:MAG: 3-oxoacyl-ACP synthase [Actinomycetota bacterium]
MGQTPVGIVDIERYSPSRFLSAAEMSTLSGVPEQVLIEKFGLYGKHIARVDEHVTDMCIAAAQPLMERNDAGAIDAVVYFGSHWKDYLVWQAAPKIQHALGIEGFALEAVNVSAGAPVALKLCRDMLSSDENLRSILLVGASKESHLLDYANPKGRFMFNFGDGAVAVLLQRDCASNEVLGSSLLTDGSFSEHVRVAAGGSANPTTLQTVESGMHVLELFDGEEMKRRLDPITMKNFIKVARQALDRSGKSVADIDLLIPLHTKRSLHDDLLTEFGLTPEQGVYLDHYGHMSAVDPLFGLSLARDEGRLSDGDIILLLAAGTGYTWAATVIRWGSA